MNILLWILQIILGIKMLTVTITHGPGQSKPAVQEAIQRMGRLTRPLLILAALGTLIGTLGLILPGITSLPGWLTPLFATMLAGMLLVSVFFHIRAREKPKVFVSFVLMVFALVVAYGRWKLNPF